MTDDDRFRESGSPYVDEEPVAFACVAPGAPVDWGDHSPAHTLRTPETPFAELASMAPQTLGQLDI